RAHLHPPVEELRLPVLERALEPAIVTQPDVVGDALAVIDGRHHTLLRSNSLRRPVPYTSSAPLGPTALPRWKIQFCQAESRPKILLSSVSGPPNRIDASMPLSASGENAARSRAGRGGRRGARTPAGCRRSTRPARRGRRPTATRPRRA